MKFVLLSILCLSHCFANIVAVRLFWSDKDKGTIESSDPDGSNRVVVHSNLGDPRGVAVDPFECKVYWAVREPIGAIYRSNYEGSDIEFVISADSPGDIELDLVGRLIYWTEQDSNSIKVAGLDTPLLFTLITGLNEPYYLALDKNYIYWSDFDSSVIHRADLEYFVPSDFITGLGRVRDIEVTNGLIYWCDRDTSDIRRRALDGAGTGMVLYSGSDFDRPHGLALDPESGELFWTDTTKDRVGAGTMDGSGVDTDVAVTDLVGPWSVAVSRLPILTNSYDAWIFDSFPDEEFTPETEATIWGLSADPDGDNLTNLVEYAQGTDPLSKTPGEDLFTVKVAEKVQVVLRMRANDPAMSYWIESSENLNQPYWITGLFEEVGNRLPDPNNSDYEFITFEAESVEPKNFMRLRVYR